MTQAACRPGDWQEVECTAWRPPFSCLGPLTYIVAYVHHPARTRRQQPPPPPGVDGQYRSLGSHVVGNRMNLVEKWPERFIRPIRADCHRPVIEQQRNVAAACGQPTWASVGDPGPPSTCTPAAIHESGRGAVTAVWKSNPIRGASGTPKWAAKAPR